MSKPIRVSDEVYLRLATIKKARGLSYSQLLREWLPKNTEKMNTHRELIDWIRSRERKNVKTRVIDHDLILYGVSRPRE